MVAIKRSLLPAFCLFVLMGLTTTRDPSIGLESTLKYFRTEAKLFAASTSALQSTISLLKDSSGILKARQQLKECRLQYKRIEFFLEYFFRSSAVIYNSAPKYEIEEPFMEYQEPVGLQVMEALLHEDDVIGGKAALLAQMEVINSSAQDLLSLLYGFSGDDKQILESVRIELVRIYTLGISGFDAPLLKSGIEESHEAMQALKYVLAPYLEEHPADSVVYYLDKSIQYLQQSRDFDSFDRLRFLQQYALPLQRTLGVMIREMQLVQNTTGGVLNYDAENLFSKNAINIDAFPSVGQILNPALLKYANINPMAASRKALNPALIKLGKMLFSEKSLSGNNQISCATCHRPEQHFTDGLKTSVAFDGHSNVRRNAPSLLYAGFQYGQFWEGRVKSLEAQTLEVMQNPQEMNGGHVVTISRLSQYGNIFKQVFRDSIITKERASEALAAFVRSLNPRNSPFDKYMEGDTTTLKAEQVRGFNLFMGKAQCGTCHFAPLFNGLVPPLYQVSELEVLGTPKNEDLMHPVADNDKGRYDVFPMSYYEQAFKTPTVRNVSATGPYMHNGAFTTLENVVEFYNRGGGNGIGLKTSTQTLSAAPLQLTRQDVADVVAFMQSLEDSL